MPRASKPGADRLGPPQRQVEVDVRGTHGVGAAGDDHHDRAALAEEARRLVEDVLLPGGDLGAADLEVDLQAFLVLSLLRV